MKHFLKYNQVNASEPVLHEPVPVAKTLNADTQPRITGRFSAHDRAVSMTLYSHLALYHDDSPV